MSPRLPQRAENVPPPEERNAGTWLALIFMLAIGGGFLALVMMMLPFKMKIIILLMIGVPATFALHYFTWGRWLMRQQRSREADETLG